MLILGIDTSSSYTELALTDGDRLISELRFGASNDHSEQIMNYLELIFKNSKLNIKDIDLFAVAIGPGSFTGTRIAISTIKAFAQALNKPVVGISSLEILIDNLFMIDNKAAIIDAKRDRVYGVIKTNDEIFLEEGLYDIDYFIKAATKISNLKICGDGCTVYKDIIDKTSIEIMPKELNIHSAYKLCKLAKIKYEENGPDNIFTLAPNYMGKSQAQIDYEKRHGKCLI